MTSSYDYGLVLVSLILAISASYAALSIATRIPVVDSRRLWFWLGAGALSMGMAIWSMHFVGMLAFHIGIPLAYDVELTTLSILYAVAASAVALILVRSGNRGLRNLILATAFMGSGIAAMHYTGMSALRMTPPITYDPALFVLSLLIAYAASMGALQLFFTAADDDLRHFKMLDSNRLIASVVMGIAIAGMHYTAMEAAMFQPGSVCGAVGSGIDTGIMSLLVVVGVIMLILINLLMLLLDLKFQDNRRLQISQQRSSSILNNAPQGMLLVNGEGKIVDANNALESISGYTRQQLLGQPVEILVPDTLRSAHVDHRRQFINQPNAQHMGLNRVLSTRHRDGREIQVEIGLAPIENEENETLILATVIDISARLALEQQIETNRQELMIANQRITLATDSAEIGIWEYELRSGKLIWDEWMCRIYGVPVDAHPATYEAWERFVYPEDLPQLTQEINLAIAGKHSLDTQFRIIRDDGETRWTKVNATLLFRHGENPTSLIGINQDITDKIAQENLVWQQANFDSLTGLPNRKLFHELLEQAVREAHRNRLQLWVLFLDLDGFKRINDTLGHHAGDELLMQVATRIKASLREADIVARLGGDEFVVIISHAEDSSYIDQLALKLINKIAAAYSLNQALAHITTSIGIANYPEDADNANELLAFADQSMYLSKDLGKNRYSYFTPELQSESLKRNQIANDLRQAIAQRELELFFQPIISLESGKIHKAEALVRWRHPQRGIVAPGEFIAIAEETGLIISLGSLVFDLAIESLQQWQPRLSKDFQLSINMSPFQIKAMPEQYDDWLQRLDQCSMSGSKIVIEITESLLLKNDQIVNERLLQYRDAGVQVAIDDFGTGYSSLAYLKEFHIDYLKIDKSFTLNLEPESSQHTLSEAIVVMAHKLGLKVIAEGVETEQQRNLLRQMGCDYAQGYLYSQPLDRGEFTARYIDSSQGSGSRVQQLHKHN